TAGSLVVLANDEVIVGDYNVVAFDKRDGALRWRFTPTDGYAPGMYLGGVAGDLIFAGSPAGRLYAIDRRSGHARWAHRVDAGAETTVFAPVADEEMVVAGYTTFAAPQTGGVVALDAATGRLRWRMPFPVAAGAMPDAGWSGGLAIVDGTVVAV